MNTQNSPQFQNEHEQKLFEKLDAASFAEVERLERESEGRIDWKTLSQEGVCEVNGKVLEGIIWPGSLNLEGTSIESLGKVKKVGGYLFCENVITLKNIGILEEVGQYFTLKGTNIESLGKLKRVGGGLNCKNVKTLKDLGELQEVGLDFYLTGTNIESLGKVEKVGQYLECRDVKTLKYIGVLEEVGRDMDVRGTSIVFQMQILIKQMKRGFKIRCLMDNVDIMKLKIITTDSELFDWYEFEHRYGSSLERTTTVQLRHEAEMIVSAVLVEAKYKRDKQIAQEIENRKNTGKAKDVNTMKDTQARIAHYESEYNSVVSKCQQWLVKV